MITSRFFRSFKFFIVLFNLISLSCYADLENTNLKIKVFRTNLKFGTLFQEKMLTSSACADAVEKMPSLIQKGYASLDMEVEKSIPDQNLATIKLNATNGKFISDDGVNHELGIQLDVRPIFNPKSGYLECALMTDHVAKFDDGVKTLKTLSVCEMQSGMPKMIYRWQEADTNLFLILESRFNGGESKQQNPKPSLYADLRFGDPDSKPKAVGEGFSGIVQIIKSGQVVTSQMEYPISVKVGGKWIQNVAGWTAELSPLWSEGDAAVTSTINLTHIHQDKKSTTVAPVMIEKCNPNHAQALSVETGKCFEMMMMRKDQLDSGGKDAEDKAKCVFLATDKQG